MFLLEFILIPGFNCSSIIDPIWNVEFICCLILSWSVEEKVVVLLEITWEIAIICHFTMKGWISLVRLWPHDEFKCQDYILTMLRHKTLKENRICHPKICYFGILIILRNSWCKKNTLNLLHLPESRKQISHVKLPSLLPEKGNSGWRRM